MSNDAYDIKSADLGKQFDSNTNFEKQVKNKIPISFLKIPCTF